MLLISRWHKLGNLPVFWIWHCILKRILVHITLNIHLIFSKWKQDLVAFYIVLWKLQWIYMRSIMDKYLYQISIDWLINDFTVNKNFIIRYKRPILRKTTIGMIRNCNIVIFFQVLTYSFYYSKPFKNWYRYDKVNTLKHLPWC